MIRLRAALWAVLFLSLFSHPSFSQTLLTAQQSQRTPTARQRRDLPDAAARLRAVFARQGMAGNFRGRLPMAVRQDRPHFAPGQYNVKFKPGVEHAIVNNLHSKAGALVVSEIPQLGIQTVIAMESAVALYRKNPNVLWIERNAMRYPLINDPNEQAYSYVDYNMSFDQSWGTWTKWDTHNIQAVDAWGVWPGHYYATDTAKAAESVTMAVIDTGVDENHEDFRNPSGTSTNAANGGQLLLSNLATIFNGVTTIGSTNGGGHDEYGHGTLVTGVAAAATNNGIGTVGSGYVANVMVIRITDDQGSGVASDLAAAIIYAADHNAVVCNVSLGDVNLFSQAEQDAVDYAWNKGMLVIAAAGNDNDGSNPPQQVYPAALSRVLAVSATTWDDNLASYSYYGDATGIGAPGGDVDLNTLSIVAVWSTMPQYHVTLNDEQAYSWDERNFYQNYDAAAGTSLASPQVAGAAALYAGMKGWRSATPGAPLQIYQALQRGGDDIVGNLSWSPYVGWGRLNMYNTMLDVPLSEPPVRGDPPSGPLGSILGYVRYLGTRVTNADVVATNTVTSQQFSTSTRSDGGYRIPYFPSGTYNVSATYFGNTKTINNVVVPDGCDVPGLDFNIGSSGNTDPIVSLTLNPTSVVGTKNSTGTATLTSNAPAGGIVVTLSSSDPSKANPSVGSVTVAAGTKTKTFTVNTFAVTSNSNVTISGSTPDGTTKQATLTVKAPSLTALTVTPATVAGTLNSTGKVTLDGAAPTGGTVVSVSSNNTAVANPAVSSVTVPAGATTATFTINTFTVTSSTGVTISATLNSTTKNATLTVRPPNISTITATPNPVAGSKPSTGKVTLEANAPTGGTVVTLTSGNTAYATVPSNVTVPAGTKTNTFAITTFAVTSTQPVTLTGTTGSVNKSTVLNVRAIGPTSVTLTPSSVVGGNNVSGTVTLEAPAGPGDITVTLTSSNTTYATVPASITINAGSTTGMFTVTTVHPASQQTSVITASANGISKTKTLTIKP